MGVRASATLRMLSGANQVVATESLTVREIAVPSGAPAANGQELVRFDTESLDRRLESKQAELTAIQRERRNPNPSDYTWALRESDAMRELSELQERLASAPVRAPSDGYVVRTIVHPGGKAKRRKPVLDFVELPGTRVAVEVESAASVDFSPGEILIIEQPQGERSFRARVERVDLIKRDESGGVTVVLVPLDLPFLRLDMPEAITITEEDPTVPR